MDIAEIQARPREARGTRGCKRLRKQDLIPAVIYGHGEPNVLLSLRRADIDKLIEDHQFIVQVDWDGKRESAQIRELQYDALGDHIVHVDFVRISLTENVTVSVPVEAHGDAAGVDEGGTLELHLHELEIECLPMAIPERLRVEVGHLGINDAVRIGEIQLPEGVAAVGDPEEVVVSVAPPVEIEEEEAEGLAVEAAEPELIGRPPEDEEAAGEGDAD
jgi:large subunit ribosomal protein L25